MVMILFAAELSSFLNEGHPVRWKEGGLVADAVLDRKGADMSALRIESKGAAGRAPSSPQTLRKSGGPRATLYKESKESGRPSAAP